MLTRIPLQATIPGEGSAGAGHLANRVTTNMMCYGLWCISYRPIGCFQSFTEVNIFKPDGMELMVEAADGLPGGAADHEEGSGGLVDGLSLSQIEVETAVAAVHSAGGDEAVEAENLEGEGGGGGEAANGEAELGGALGVDEASADGGDLGASEFSEHGIDSGEQDAVGIQDQHKGLGGEGEAAIDAAGKAEIFGMVFVVGRWIGAGLR